jgi:hypothetical protein
VDYTSRIASADWIGFNEAGKGIDRNFRIYLNSPGISPIAPKSG